MNTEDLVYILQTSARLETELLASILDYDFIGFESRRDGMSIENLFSNYLESRRDGMSIDNGSINRMSPVRTECL